MTIYVEYISGGYCIKHYAAATGDLVKMRYIGHTLSGAIKAHRNNFNLQHKHLEKIYL